MSCSRNIWWNLAYPLTVNRVRLSASLTVICWQLRLGRRLDAFQIHTIRWRHSRLAPLTVTVTVSVAFRNVSISSWSVSLTKRKRFCHCIFYSVYIYSNISKYIYTLFLFALFLRLKFVLTVAKYPCTAFFHLRSLDYLSLIILPGKSCGKLKTIHLSALSANNCVLFFFLIKLCSFWCDW